MAVIKLILTATDVTGCRIFARGEQLTVDYPRDAFYRLLEWKEGQFHFQPAESMPTSGNIPKDAMELVMEGMRHVDGERVGVPQGEAPAQPG